MKCSKCSAEYEGNFCPNCGSAENGVQPTRQPSQKKKKPFYKRFWFIALVVIVVIAAVSSIKTKMSEKAAFSATISWPQSKVGKLVPQPKSLTGKLEYEDESGFSVTIGKTAREDYDAYVAACMADGFNVDYYKSENSYMAKNKDGVNLSVEYNANNTMAILVAAASEKETTKELPSTEEKTTKAPKATEEKTTKPSKPTEEKKESTGLRPEFKEAMDSYEDFMNKYVDFMKKYAESGGTDLSIIVDYANYMSKYTDMVSKFEAWENEDLNDEEMAYYLKVQARVTQKLMDVAL